MKLRHAIAALLATGVACSAQAGQVVQPGGSGGGSNPAAGTTGVAVPGVASYTGINVGGNLVGVSSTNPLPVSGSFSLTNPTTGVAVPTTANFIAGNKAGNLVGLLLDSNGYLQMSAAALPLPTGAATSALQPAVQAAGSGSATSVITVQGNASGTPIPVTGSFSSGVAQGSTTSGQTGTLTQAAVTTSAPAYTSGQTSPLSLDTSGNLRVNVVASGAGGVAVTLASGSVASGAYLAGSIAANALAAGASVDIGTYTDTTTYAGSGNMTLLAGIRGIYNVLSGSGPATLNTPAAVTVNGVSGTATLIAPARTGASGTGRILITIENTGTTALNICSTAACTTGFVVPGTAGASLTLQYNGAVYGYVASGSAVVSYYEEY